ncbi:MAG: HAMP domain-containing sensor histidine kinase [Steroidobacteraceae bacterium]
MTPQTAPAELARPDLATRIIGLTNLYRLLAGTLLFTVHLATRPSALFGAAQPDIFLLACVTYLILGLLLTLAGRSHWPSRRTLIFSHTLIDTAAIATLMFTSGGVSSGLGILLVIPVGAMALLGEGRDPLLLAALAAVGLLLQQIAAQLAGLASSTDYMLAGVMGAVVFLVALCAWPVSNRLRESEALVRRQEVDLANLAELSQYIVQHLRESILVVDPTDRIRLINDSAALLLGTQEAVPGALLGEASPRLLYLMTHWRRDHELPPGDAGTFVAHDGAHVVRPHFAQLGSARPGPLIVFLEDTAALAERVQQSKLAALGRLSASIAHEIRNPVGAMSHAAQLLAEAPDLAEQERRLTEIMRSNAVRVSAIIDNVLQLSRREAPRPQRLELDEWCREFCEEFRTTRHVDARRLPLHVSHDALPVRADPTQLHQLLWNLCENAFTHGRGLEEPVELRAGRMAGSGRPYLEVADRGPGIAAADAERIFEPFFTRAVRGTGLGLFLARELAQSNGATLLYEARSGGGSVFRIVFSDPTRWEN